jgi:hypothetical protein
MSTAASQLGQRRYGRLSDRAAIVSQLPDSVPVTDGSPGEPPVPIAPSLPEPGQIVEVRGSTWAVANVQAQGLPLSPADDATAQLNHVVDLQSLDEDRLGDQLSVIWELEVPYGFG